MNIFAKKHSINNLASHLKIDNNKLLKWKYLDNTKLLNQIQKTDDSISTNEYIDYLNENVEVEHDEKDKILIIDDDESIFLAMKQFLSKLNLNAIWARDGLEACYLLKLHNPKIITLDLKMNLYDGNDFLQMIDKINLSLKPWIIVVSGDKSEPIYKSLDNGADFFLRKPLKKSDFFKIINKIA